MFSGCNQTYNLKQVLIIYPHWPPSNLAGVHRPRLIANFLPEFDWQPIVLTVHASYYEETPDPDLLLTVRSHVEVIKTQAWPVRKIFGYRLIGDVGLRGFTALYKEALRLVATKKIDFIWIPIPSWYTALLGPLLHQKTGIPYGIDYIDPWVSKLANHEKTFSRAWWVNQLARLLEPLAVKKASLITGVSTPYYQGVLDRNFKHRPIEHVGMPYGFDPEDHRIQLPNLTPPWESEDDVIPYLYAGAFLPQSHYFVQTLFKAIAELKSSNVIDARIRLYFLGTGNYQGKTIAEYADEYGLGTIVKEVNQRFPFLHILNFLGTAQGVIVIGSTERHYTASKTFQSLLSGRPVFAMFHEASTAVEFLEKAQAANYLVKYAETQAPEALQKATQYRLQAFFALDAAWNPDLSVLDDYSAHKSAELLAQKMDTVFG
ncbi:hypothetical protein Halhy_2880 [Haliscomenobacter hydrossis DSM 1100]|uniref:Glycosyltransferase subfamily 4-like N-terminal domain-containing protein n=1 Tax=Haliscomenobacter hydrossis (strain ATCC 27775 / DSM 1100 / LMG 10767 / O) TaxID=760192 RepID=F4L447_HALH1|nr:hypothetical protein Halhy_2880 [Haliscomenobacter hydrossis DSM 1100]